MFHASSKNIVSRDKKSCFFQMVTGLPNTSTGHKLNRAPTRNNIGQKICFEANSKSLKY